MAADVRPGLLSAGDGPAGADPDKLLALALAKPAEALTAAQALLAAGPPPLLAAIAHQAAGVVLRDFGDMDAAITEFRLALRLVRPAGQPDREAEIRGSLGIAWVLAGQPRRGLAVLDQALAGCQGAAAGRILLRRANAHWVLGRHAQALRDAQSAVGLLSGTDDLIWEARALHWRAVAYLTVGDIERADRDYTRVEELHRESGQLAEYASARHERGVAAHARGDLPAALACLDHAQELFDQLGTFAAELFVDKCTVLLAAGLAADALREVETALATSERVAGSATRRAELVYCAALAAVAAGDLDLAEHRSGEALALFRGQRRLWWAARAELVSLLCRFAARPDDPAALLAPARRLAGRLGQLDPVRAPEGQLLAGRLALASGRRAEAGRHLAAAAAARNRGQPRARAAGWLAQATWCEAQQQWRGMLAACDRGLAQLDLHLQTLGATELRTLATAHGAELAGMALRHAVRRGDARQFLAWSERWRAVGLRVTPVLPPPDPDLVTDLAALRGVAARLDAEPPGRPAPPALARERRRLEAAVRQRVLRTPALASGSSGSFVLPDLLGQLAAAGASLVELTESGGQRYATVAAAGRVVLRHIGPAADASRALDHALFALRRENAGRGPTRLDLAGIGRRLEAGLLGESARLLPPGPVVVAPSGRLHAVPWSLLPSLAGRPVSVVPSAAAWLRARRARWAGPRRVVLVGGPRLSTGDAEVTRLAARYPDAVLLAGPDAVAERVLAAMDGAWLVHLAAHGTFRADSPLFSAVELADGPLTGYDLERLHRPPHRVVLSNCSSGVGVSVGADELLGLVSALIAVGTAGVVASVVPVSDPATVPLMLGLHDQLQRGAGLAGALQLARQAAGPDPVAQSTAHSFIALGA